MDFEEDDDEPTVHIARPGTDSAYCGYELTERLSWVAESQVTPETSTCTDCERLQSEWQAVRRRT